MGAEAFINATYKRVTRIIPELPDRAFWHKVQPDDTLPELASFFYGRANVIRGIEIIKDMNPFLLQDEQLLDGDMLAIPTLKHDACIGLETHLEPAPESAIAVKVSVVQNWVSRMPLEQQIVVLSALRKPDVSSRHPCLTVHHSYIACVLKCPFVGRALEDGEQSKYMDASRLPDLEWETVDVRAFFDTYEELSETYLTAFFMATNILGMWHHNPRWRNRWARFYEQSCEIRNVYPEPHDVLNKRLNDNGRKLWGV